MRADKRQPACFGVIEGGPPPESVYLKIQTSPWAEGIRWRGWGWGIALNIAYTPYPLCAVAVVAARGMWYRVGALPCVRGAWRGNEKGSC